MQGHQIKTPLVSPTQSSVLPPFFPPQETTKLNPSDLLWSHKLMASCSGPLGSHQFSVCSRAPRRNASLRAAFKALPTAPVSLQGVPRSSPPELPAPYNEFSADLPSAPTVPAAWNGLLSSSPLPVSFFKCEDPPHPSKSQQTAPPPRASRTRPAGPGLTLSRRRHGTGPVTSGATSCPPDCGSA